LRERVRRRYIAVRWTSVGSRKGSALNLKVVKEGGVKVVEGEPREQLLTCVEDVRKVLSCLLMMSPPR
jgi:hypothetical protein